MFRGSAPCVPIRPHCYNKIRLPIAVNTKIKSVKMSGSNPAILVSRLMMSATTFAAVPDKLNTDANTSQHVSVLYVLSTKVPCDAAKIPELEKLAHGGRSV